MMSMPPGSPPPQPPVVPPDDDDVRDAGRRSDEVDADAAAAEALGYADPEDAAIAIDDEAEAEDPVDGGSSQADDDASGTDDGSSQAPDLDGPALKGAELKKAGEAEHPQPTTHPEANPYLRPS